MATARNAQAASPAKAASVDDAAAAAATTTTHHRTAQKKGFLFRWSSGRNADNSNREHVVKKNHSESSTVQSAPPSRAKSKSKETSGDGGGGPTKKPSSAPSTPTKPSSTAPSGGKATSPKKTNKKTIPMKSSWICRTKYFRRICDDAFEVIDRDQSGTVDQQELYSGLLLIHLKLGVYAGPAACKPLSRQRCADVFHKMDVDNSGALDKKEFREVMMVLFSNVVLRVAAQWSLTIMIVPLIASRILDGVLFVYHAVANFVYNLDEHSSWANQTELALETAGQCVQTHTPGLVKTSLGHVSDLLDKVPESVWEAAPLTLMSTILSILVVPWVLFRIDDFFQWYADRYASKKKSA